MPGPTLPAAPETPAVACCPGEPATAGATPLPAAGTFAATIPPCGPTPVAGLELPEAPPTMDDACPVIEVGADVDVDVDVDGDGDGEEHAKSPTPITPERKKPIVIATMQWLK